jgi:hypothetical protein
MKVDSLIRRAKHLLRSTSTEELDEEWEMMCSAAKDELLAELAARITEEDGEAPSDEGDLSFFDEPWVAEFDAFLGEQAEFDKQQFIRQRGRRGRRRVA